MSLFIHWIYRDILSKYISIHPDIQTDIYSIIYKQIYGGIYVYVQFSLKMEFQ